MTSKMRKIVLFAAAFCTDAAFSLARLMREVMM